MPDTPTDKEESDYVGTVTVIYNDEPFDNENIKVTFIPGADGETASIKIHKIRFVPKMPVTIDVTVPGVSTSSEGSKTVLSCERSIPRAMGGEYPKYTVTDLSGEIAGDELTFSLNFGEYPTSFKGRLNNK
jgi:hypothetical protein